MTYNTIMVALVGDEDEVTVIEQAVRISKTFQVPITVVHVNSPHAGEMSMMMNTPGHRFTEKEIRDLFRSLGFKDIADQMKVRILEGNVIHKEITKAAKDADLLILGHRKMSSFKEYFFDSIDEGIVNHVDCPVLVVPKN